MASVNKVISLATGKDRRRANLPSGDAVVLTLVFATTEKFKDKSGAQQEHTEWHRISFLGAGGNSPASI
jgi:single-strand DNA-binding protein